MAAKVKKGDRVVVLAGRDKGKQGEVLKVLPKEHRVVVQGVMVVKRHQKPTQKMPQGGITEKELPIHASNVMPIDSKTNRGTRTKTVTEGDKKVRVGVKSGTPFPQAGM